MTAVMSYNSLSNQLRDWLERNGDNRFLNQIPTIIAQAEFMLAREYKGLGEQQSVTASFQAGVSVYPKPARWRETVEINYGIGATSASIGNKRRYLKKRTLDYCRRFWPDPTSSDATYYPPKFYAEYSWDYILVAPTPALAYPWEFIYYQRPQPLDQNNQQNWFTLNAPDLLFKACTLWANRYVRGDARSTLLQQDYDRGLMTAMGEDVRRLLDAPQEPKQGT